jgi:hypothetical protein
MQLKIATKIQTFLRQLIHVSQFQSDHQMCDMDSGYKNKNWVPEFTILRDLAAVDTSYRVFAFFDTIVLTSSRCKPDGC